MKSLSISVEIGNSKPKSAERIANIEHNHREKLTQKAALRVDKNRTQNNIIYENKNIKTAYEELFSDSLNEYNSRQKQPCRMIKNYYDHIEKSKKEKLFYEAIIQFGDKETSGIGINGEQISTQMLDNYMREFQNRNPNLIVFSATLHMDESTPHLHIDFIPVAKNFNKKHGLSIKNSLTGALENQGIVKQKGKSEMVCWIEKEKSEMAK
jgi:hypothetical protein